MISISSGKIMIEKSRIEVAIETYKNSLMTNEICSIKHQIERMTKQGIKHFLYTKITNLRYVDICKYIIKSPNFKGIKIIRKTKNQLFLHPLFDYNVYCVEILC